MGSASVGSAAGRATVGRASVGGPGGRRDATTGPGGGRPGGVRGLLGLGGNGPSTPGAKKARRRNIIIASIAAVIMLTGFAVVGGTYYMDSVTLPEQEQLSQSTMVYFSDGKTPMAKLGKENRTLVTGKQIPDFVKQAVISAEDRTFEQNNGIDVKGILRAAWNNFTGGDRQGASTITQQYARHVADLSGITYSRKLREAVIAMKLNQKYTKDKIMEMYLNTVYFGRNATGIEAASQAYFNKSVDKLNVAEAMVLAAVIKQPEKDPATGNPGYDPANSLENAKARWNYVKQGMVDLGFMSQADADKLQYPTTWVKPDPNKPIPGAQWGIENGQPNGNIVNQVRQELAKVGIKDLRNPGGLKIITTIDPIMQKAAINAANRDLKTSPVYGQPKNLQAALVAVQAKTGRVLAYYGGNNPTGTDYAGINYDDNGRPWGGHEPGSSFKAYVLAEALQEGYSIQSMWNGSTPRTFKTRQSPVLNCCGENYPRVSLQDATVESLNTVYYALTEKLGYQKVLELAAKAGVRTMWDKPAAGEAGSHAWDLTKGVDHFDNSAGIGQFPITVLDNAAGFATFAGGGIAAPTHFVEKVYDASGKLIYGEQVKQTRVLSPETVADLDYVLKKVVDHGGTHDDGRHHSNQPDGRVAAGKTGTWDYNGDVDANLHAWMVGYTPNQLSAAVWVGNAGKNAPIQWKVRGEGLQMIYGAGLPAEIWKQFLEQALDGTHAPKTTFPQPVFKGDPDKGELPAEAPPPAPSNPPGNGGGNKKCLPILPCPPGGQGGGTGGGTTAGGTTGGTGGGTGTLVWPSPTPSTAPTRRW
ncbi:MAG TPA: transglycosylase domain-containing protein [Micromonosporaceae bacterium]